MQQLVKQAIVCSFSQQVDAKNAHISHTRKILKCVLLNAGKCGLVRPPCSSKQ